MDMDKLRKLLCKWFDLVPSEDMTKCVNDFHHDIYAIIDGGAKGTAIEMSYWMSREIDRMIWEGDA